MIVLTRLDGKELVVNADHILTAEATPDTVLQLTTGLRLMVREPVNEVVEKVAAWRRRILAGPEVSHGPEPRRPVVPFPRSVPAPTPEE
ncbi:MAG TPA: flagellar FlbD family protein [Anaeromyxobacteraceae bacterium]|nr:flagellar FlbD family protein [Anaeromyxobacteraceae bacterium]